MELPVDLIFGFLKDIAVHNNREWFYEHRERYDEVRTIFEDLVQQVIFRIGLFDESVHHLQPKDCTYRFNRDTRFSQDKSPYKLHLGAYINACGKKSLHSGYYFQIQPGACLIAGGAWCLPSPVLNAVRRSVVDQIDEFRMIVEAPDFKAAFPVIGESHLKTLPKGFSKGFPFPEYIRPKDYSVSHHVADDFFRQENWLDRTEALFKLMKPYNDFINYTIDEQVSSASV